MKWTLPWPRHTRTTKTVSLWAWGLSSFHLLFFMALIADPNMKLYSNDGYEVLVRFAPLYMWALGFLVPGIVLIFAAFSRWTGAWVIGMFFSTIVTMSWIACVIFARLDGASLTMGNVVLWLWFLFTNIVAVTRQGQIEESTTEFGSLK